MAKEIRTDFDVVEKERTVYICDNCGREVDDAIEVVLNPNPRRKTRLELVQVVDDEIEAQEMIRRHNMNERRFDYNDLAPGIGKQSVLSSVEYSAKADWCHACIVDGFGIDDVEPADVENIRTDGGKLVIETIEERTSLFPIWSKEETMFGWKLNILLWPLALGFALIAGVVDGDERWQGYTAASLGSILWFLIVMFLLFL